MKLFVKNISILLIIILCLFIILDFFVFPNNKNTYNYKAGLLQNKEVEVLISGNSHLGFGVLADSVFNYNTVNIATKARELNTDIDLLINNIENREKLKAVLIPISYYSLFGELNVTNEYHKGQMRLYYNFFKIKKYDQGILNNSLIINEPFRELMDDSYFLSFMKKRKVSKKGWRANGTSFVKDTNIIGKLKRLDISINNLSLVENNLNRIKELNAKCKVNNVKLILVLPPYSAYFYSLTNYKYSKIINKIISDKLKNIQIIDALDFMSTDLVFYENSDHLNVKGAKVFTKKLDSILKASL